VKDPNGAVVHQCDRTLAWTCQRASRVQCDQTGAGSLFCSPCLPGVRALTVVRQRIFSRMVAKKDVGTDRRPGGGMAAYWTIAFHRGTEVTVTVSLGSLRTSKGVSQYHHRRTADREPGPIQRAQKLHHVTLTNSPVKRDGAPHRRGATSGIEFRRPARRAQTASKRRWRRMPLDTHSVNASFSHQFIRKAFGISDSITNGYEANTAGIRRLGKLYHQKNRGGPTIFHGSAFGYLRQRAIQAPPVSRRGRPRHTRVQAGAWLWAGARCAKKTALLSLCI